MAQGYGQGSNRRSAASQQASAQDARARYEEALRRSDERRASVQRGSRHGYDSQRELLQEEQLLRNPPRKARGSELQQGQQPTRQRPAQQQRRVVHIESSEGMRAYQPQAQKRPAQPSANRAAQYGRESGNYRARPATFSTSAPAPQATGRGLVVRIVIVVVLLIIAALSFGRCSSAQDTLTDANSQVNEQQAQLDALTESNESLQGQADSAQNTIEAYNELVQSQS